MHESQSSQPIETLLNSRPDVWRGRQRPAGPILSSGQAELDAWLPAGGWPSGRLTELLPVHFGLGELALLLPLVARQTSQGMPVILAGPPLVPCPQHLARCGIALDRLVVVRKPDQAFWAAEQSLKSGLCGAVILWPPCSSPQARAVRRLQLAAESGQAPVFVCYRPGQQPPPSLAALRLAIHPGPELVLLRGQDGSRRLHLARIHETGGLERGNVVQLRSLSRSA